MNRKLAGALGLVIIAVVGAASCNPQPETSGTSTNWLKICTSDQQCAPSGSCMCGLCTAGCSGDSDCSPGICGSALATTFQCAEPRPERICLPSPPDAGTCSEFPILANADLASASDASCATPGALLCETFDAPLPGNDSTWYSGAMSAGISDCRVHQGTGAIHYQTDTGGYSQTRMRLAQPVSSGLLAARFYAYIPSGLTVSNYLGMFELWDQSSGSSGKISVEAKPNDALEVYVTPNGTTHLSAPGTLLRDQWMCLSLTLDIAASDGSLSLAVNGAAIIDHEVAVTALPSPISVAVVEGLPSSDETGVDLTIDDLVVATQPLPCP